MNEFVFYLSIKSSFHDLLSARFISNFGERPSQGVTVNIFHSWFEHVTEYNTVIAILKASNKMTNNKYHTVLLGPKHNHKIVDRTPSKNKTPIVDRVKETTPLTPIYMTAHFPALVQAFQKWRG